MQIEKIELLRLSWKHSYYVTALPSTPSVFLLPAWFDSSRTPVRARRPLCAPSSSYWACRGGQKTHLHPPHGGQLSGHSTYAVLTAVCLQGPLQPKGIRVSRHALVAVSCINSRHWTLQKNGRLCAFCLVCIFHFGEVRAETHRCENNLAD